MILITGGMAQGKTAFGESLHLPMVDNLEMRIKDWLAQGIKGEQQIFEKVMQEIEKEQEKEKEVVIIVREIGCGIIPVDQGESRWREVTGRTACRIASQAHTVYKMESGIAVRIK